MDTPGFALDTTWRTLLKDLGVAPADVLRRAGLADDLLQQPSVRLAPADYYRLWDSIEAALIDGPLALRLCEAVRSESFSPPLFAALCSPNLLVAARRIAQFKPLVAPIRFAVTEAGERVTVAFAWPGDEAPPVSLVMMELLFCVTLARMGTREAIRPLAVTTLAPPVPLAPYEAFLGTRVERGAAHQVTFSLADATRPFLTSNEPLWAAFEPGLRQRLADLEASATTARRVRAALLEGLPSGLLASEDIARKLALSKRTLQRRLEAEGTGYQQVLDETRADLARHYLEKTTLPVAEISFLLGFDEANSFYRAFRSWTGSTPHNVRRLQAGAAARA